MALVTLSFFREAAAAAQLADTVQAHGGLLGACVCCAENGGDKGDEWTTCERDRDQLLDRYDEQPASVHCMHEAHHKVWEAF